MSPADSKLPQQLNLIAGEWSAPTIPLEPWICDSNSGEQLAQQQQTSDDDLERAISSAVETHYAGEMSDLSLQERADYLDRIATTVEKSVDDMAYADAITTGVVIRDTNRLAGLVPFVFKMAAEQLRDGWMNSTLPGRLGPVEVSKKPIGPVGLISPWNAPATITAHKIASALAAGCPSIVKPSEWAPHSVHFIIKAIEAAGLPANMVQLVHGPAHVGGVLVTDKRIRAISFTGGLTAGKNIGRVCGESLKPAQLELGGNNPLMVLADADIDNTADGIITALTTLNGQWCRALGRVFAHESVAEPLLEAVKSRLKNIQLGHSLNPESTMGPMVHSGHYTFLKEHSQKIQSNGATLHASTPMPELPGYFLAPTLISGVDSQESQDELFGPLAFFHTFKTETEALQLANEAPFGLSAYVFGEENRALEFGQKIETGMVKVNGVTMLGLNPNAPRSAWKLSGLGVEGARESIDFFSGTTVTGVAHRLEEGQTK